MKILLLQQLWKQIYHFKWPFFAWSPKRGWLSVDVSPLSATNSNLFAFVLPLFLLSSPSSYSLSLSLSFPFPVSLLTWRAAPLIGLEATAGLNAKCVNLMTATISTPAEEERGAKGSIDSNSRCAAGTVYRTLRHSSLLTVKRNF